MLNIDWQGQGWAGAEAFQHKQAILDDIAGRDRRPLLIQVMRKETDTRIAAYLKAALKSERFQLASKWFQCYQLPAEVLEEKHAYHPLFDDRNPPHLLLISRDGRKSAEFLGTRSRTVKWSKIAQVLAYEYRENPTRSVKDIERLLSEFDAVDSRIADTDKRIAAAEESKDATKLRGLKRDRAELDREQQQLFARKKKLETLQLRRPAKAPDSKGLDR